MTSSFQKACVRGNGWSVDPKSEPRGWRNRNCKTSRNLKWVNGSDITGVHLCQGCSPRHAVFPRWLSVLSGNMFTWHRGDCRRPGFNPWVGKIPWRRKLPRLRSRCSPLAVTEADQSSWPCWQQSLSGFWHSSTSPRVLLLFFSFKFQWFYMWLSQCVPTCLPVTFLMVIRLLTL